MAAEYPGALWLPAHPSNYGAPRAFNDIDRVVIHITDGHGDAKGPANMFRMPKSTRVPPIASSAHFIVGQDATIIQSVPILWCAYHAHSANGRSIAIEHCARTPSEFGKSDPGLPVSPQQYEASARLAAFLCKLCALPRTRTTIQGHCEIDLSTTHTDCPNAIWDWPRYMALVTGL